jgi:hypothetical protein
VSSFSLQNLIGRRGANPANKINFYSNENTPQFTQGVFTTIFNAAMTTRRSAWQDTFQKTTRQLQKLGVDKAEDFF